MRIESPGGVTIATDYAGWTGRRGVPRVVTMNKAHETHLTSTPDPAIEHVLRGWNPDGGRSIGGTAIVRYSPTDISTEDRPGLAKQTYHRGFGLGLLRSWTQR